MPKVNRSKIFLIGILSAILMFIGFQYFKFMSLEVYEWDDNLITKEGIIYEDSPDLLIEYLNGEMKAAETIGRFKEDSFIGFKTWVIRLEGVDQKDAFLVRGLMFDGVYRKSNQK